MAVKLRLTRMGAKKAPRYRVVAADSRSPRDGRVIDTVGYFDPTTQPETIHIDADKAIAWLKNGAQPSDTVRTLLSKEGILKRYNDEKHAAKGTK